MKACPLEESYLMPEDLSCQPMLYVTVSLILLLFFSLSYREHQSPYYWLLCSSVLLFPPEEPLQSPNLSPTVRPCLHVLQLLWSFFSRIPSKVDSTYPRVLLILSPPPPISCIPKTHWNLIEHHLSAAYRGSLERCLVLCGRRREKLWLLRRLSYFFSVALEINGEI